MTQYRCSRCGNFLNGNATFCPHCGTPISSMQPQEPKAKSGAWLYVLIGVLLAACLGVGVWLLLDNNKKDNVVQPSKTEAKATVSTSDTDASSDEKAKKEDDVKAKSDAASSTGEQSSAPTQTGKSSSAGVYMGMWGRIGDSDQAEFEMNGTTGTYSYTRQGQNSGKRTLRLMSYDVASGRCIIDAFAAGKKIGTFDGIFTEMDETDDEGEHHYGQSYNGKFKSTNGAQLDFMLYFD